MTPEITNTLCERIELGEHLYEIVWHDRSNQAVDMWFHHMVTLYENSTPDDILRIIVRPDMDLSELPSLSYIVKRSRELQKQFPERAKTRTALLMKQGVLSVLFKSLNQFAISQKHDVTKIFNLNDYDNAKAWVIED